MNILESNKPAPMLAPLLVLIPALKLILKLASKRAYGLLLLCICCIALPSMTVNAKEEINDELRNYLKHAISQSDSFVDRYDAEVWLFSKSPSLERFIEDPQQRLDLLRKIHRAAKQAGLKPEWVLAVIEVESGFDSYAISRAGALGIMQVMPFWKNEIGRPDDNLINMETNLRYGCTILKYYLDKAEGRLHEALARYNGSHGSYKYPQKVMTAWEKYWR